MMTPLRRATAGGDQEKFTCLSPATATNISGAPSGTEQQDNNHVALLHGCSKEMPQQPPPSPFPGLVLAQRYIPYSEILHRGVEK